MDKTQAGGGTIKIEDKLDLKIDHVRKHIDVNFGSYTLVEDLIFPVGYSVKIPKGTEIFLGEGVSILVQGNLTASGTPELPIKINRFDINPFGSLLLMELTICRAL